MLGAMQRMLVLGFGWLLCAQVARAESFDQIVEAYGGAAAFDIILVQDCSVLDNSSEAALDQEYNAKLCSVEDESALSDVANLLRSKGFNTVEVALSTAGAQVRPEARKSAADILDIYAAPELSSVAREAYIATLRRMPGVSTSTPRRMSCTPRSSRRLGLRKIRWSSLWLLMVSEWRQPRVSHRAWRPPY